jgi:ribosome modulation factor/uncharacterized protein (UPF0335 family)
MSMEGHNMHGGLTQDQRRALFLMGLKKVETAIEAKDKAVAALREVYKKTKADGFPKATFDRHFKLRKLEDDEVSFQVSEDMRLLRWAGRGYQLDIEDFVKPKGADEVESEGFAAGVQRDPRESPYTQAAQRKRWLEAYDRGVATAESLAERAQALAEEEGDPDPEPFGGGRNGNADGEGFGEGA